MMVPFGITNAPTTFMCLMNSVFSKYLDKLVLVFLDDILIYSKNEEEHEDHLRMTLQLLREHKFYAKLRKCDFYKDKIHYLGHIISGEGISVDPEKIEAIMNWPTPRNVIDVRSFMGPIGYYRRFIEGFSKVTHSITSLQKKGIKFEWTPRCEESFQQLKNLLTSAPILKIADLQKDFVVCTGACNQGLGGYYRRFIEGFSKFAHSITSLQRNGIKFEWTPRCEEIFQQLKNILISAPILTIADP